MKQYDPVRLTKMNDKYAKYNLYQNVELLIEDPKFASLGIHKGDIGTIMEDFCVQNEVLVDFGRLDDKNNFVGDCVSVNLKYLKLLDKD